MHAKGQLYYPSYSTPSKFEEASYDLAKGLYINPNPQQFAFTADVSAYPVDTLIPHASPAVSLKHEVPESQDPFGGASVMTQKNMFSSELENLLSEKPEDVGASWMLPANPPNKEELTARDFDYAIPSDFNSLFLDLPDAHGLDMSNPSPQSIPNDTEPLPMQVTDLWGGSHGDDKGVTKKVVLSPESGENTLSQVEHGAASPEDPFVGGQMGTDLILTSDTFNFRASAPSLSDIYAELNGETTSPVLSPESVDQSSDLSTANTSGTAIWDSLPELFENFDFSDSSFLLPPPAKRPHNDPYFMQPTAGFDDQLPVTVKQELLVESRTPSPSHTPPPTPSPQPMAPVSPPQPVVAKKEVESKASTPPKAAKGPLLFGKHENEIIHKLLIPHKGLSKKPVTRDKLVSMPVEEFNQLLEQAKLTEIEVAFMKEWRRRGKNKTAAQVARKRKREEITELDVEVEGLRQRKVELQSKYDRIRSQIASLKERTIAAEDKIYRRWGKQHGTAVSRDSHTILVSEEGKVLLVPKINSHMLMLK